MMQSLFCAIEFCQCSSLCCLTLAQIKRFFSFFYLFLNVGMLGTVTTSLASCGEGVILLSLVIIS